MSWLKRAFKKVGNVVGDVGKVVGKVVSVVTGGGSGPSFPKAPAGGFNMPQLSGNLMIAPPTALVPKIPDAISSLLPTGVVDSVNAGLGIAQSAKEAVIPEKTSFFGKLFEKVPGGSTVGNFLKEVGSKIAPGILGTGKNQIPSDGTQSTSLGNSLFGDIIKTVGSVFADTPQGKELVKETITEKIKSNWEKIALYGLAVGGVIYALVKPKTSNNKFSNKSKFR